MKKIGFVGAFDKINLIMYVAKVLKDMNKRVLVIDGTMLQKSKYIVPTISHTKMYITNFEKIDFAVGFQSLGQIMQYLGLEVNSEQSLPYDYVLVDVDNRVALKSFYVEKASVNFFVTGFDMYSLKRGVDILSGLEKKMLLTKILYSNDVTREDEEYLNYLSLEKNIEWNEMEIYCPLLELDNKAIEENQRIEKIRVKKLSNNYVQAIIYIVQSISEEESASSIKKSILE